MEKQVENINSYTKKIKVALSPDDLKEIEKKVTRDYQHSAQIKGFRKGRAPLNLVKQQYGEMIQRDVMDEAIRSNYSKIFEDSDFSPVSQGKITNFQFENIESGLTFEIEIEIEPEFEVKKYKGLKVEKDVFEVTDKMVDQALQRLREQYATVKEVEVAQEDYYVYFDAQELDQGNIPVVGHKYDDLEVQLGTGKFDPQIEQQLLGIKKGEKRIVKTVTPPQPGSRHQKPTENKLEIYVKKIEEKEFPSLDEDFIKNLNDETIETIEQLQQRIKQNMIIDLNTRSEQTFYNRLIDELLKENPFDLPPTMVDNYLNEMIKDFRNQSKGKAVNEEAIRKEYRVSAIHHLRWYFLKKKLMEIEPIEITEENIDQHLESLHLEEKAKKQAMKDRSTREHVKDDLIEQQILELLKKEAQIIEVFPQSQPKVRVEGNSE
jgi:trigger factor